MAIFLFVEGLELDFFNPRSLLCFIAVLQGAVFAALLVFRYFKERKTADLWLALLLFLLCSSLVTPLIGFANVYDRNQWLTYFPFTISYGAGVCIWFYTSFLTDSKRRFRARDLALFGPTFVYLAFRFYLFAHDLEWKDRFGDSYGRFADRFVFVTETVWNLVFLYLSTRHYRKYRAWLDENFSDTEKLKFDWLRNFLYLFTAVLLVGAVFDFTNSFVFRLSYIQFFYFQIVLALTTYYLAVAGYLRSKTIELDFNAGAAAEFERRKTRLPEKELERLKTRLAGLMRDEKVYREPDLTLGELARLLGVNSSVLSYAINAGFGRNFNDFVNEYRIAEVCQKLDADAGATLLQIAFESGFNSKATFNRAFKKFTGATPKEYLANGR